MGFKSIKRVPYRPRFEALEGLVLPSTYTVTTCNDSGAGSFRQAINDANGNSGLDTINFTIGSGVQTCAPATALPTITDPVIIDGTTQPGSGTTPRIVLNGINALGSSGLIITAGGSTVKGLAINGFPNDGIQLVGNGGNVIEANFIGTDHLGTTRVPNGDAGINIGGGSSGNTIGGTSASATRNLISGNDGYGVYIHDGGTSGNIVLGNYIGTGVGGGASFGNAGAGVRVEGGASNNVIGGILDQARNVISGNFPNGVVLTGAGTTGNEVLGNYIGLNATGTDKVANGDNGVYITAGASNNTIGGLVEGARNIISGNGDRGVSIEGSTTNGNVVIGNYIGVNVVGMSPIANGASGVGIGIGSDNNRIGGTTAAERNVISGNDGHGVRLQDAGTTGNQVLGNFIGTNAAGTNGIDNRFNGVFIDLGASNNTVGGTIANAGNRISGNLENGVLIDGASTIGNAIRQNTILANGALGIDLANNGNNNQAAPKLNSVTSGGGSTTIQGSMVSTPNTTFVIEFVSNAVCDPSGKGEGEIFLGSKSVTTSATGRARANAVFGVSVPAGYFITATATSPSGDTSEFSTCLVVPSAGAPLPNELQRPALISTKMPYSTEKSSENISPPSPNSLVNPMMQVNVVQISAPQVSTSTTRAHRPAAVAASAPWLWLDLAEVVLAYDLLP